MSEQKAECEFDARVVEHLDAASVARGWLVGVWYYDGSMIQQHLVTHNFSVDDFGLQFAAILNPNAPARGVLPTMIVGLTEMSGVPQIQEPMKPAGVRRPLVNLFGNPAVERED